MNKRLFAECTCACFIILLFLNCTGNIKDSHVNSNDMCDTVATVGNSTNLDIRRIVNMGDGKIISHTFMVKGLFSPFRIALRTDSVFYNDMQLWGVIESKCDLLTDTILWLNGNEFQSVTMNSRDWVTYDMTLYSYSNDGKYIGSEKLSRRSPETIWEHSEYETIEYTGANSYVKTIYTAWQDGVPTIDRKETYNNHGKILLVESGNGEKRTEYQYRDDGRLLTEIKDGIVQRTYVYDSLGREARAIYYYPNDTIATDFKYDDNGLLVSESSVPSSDSKLSHYKTYEYDGQNRISSIKEWTLDAENTVHKDCTYLYSYDDKNGKLTMNTRNNNPNDTTYVPLFEYRSNGKSLKK